IGQARLIAQEPSQTAPGEVRQAVGLRLHPPQTAEHQRQGYGPDAADEPADDARAAGRRQGGGQQVDARSDHVPRHHQGGQAPADVVRRFRQDVDLAHARRIDRNVAAVAMKILPRAVAGMSGRRWRANLSPKFWSSPMPVTTVGLDADDTLWHNETIFRLSQKRFAELLADHAEEPVMMD